MSNQLSFSSRFSIVLALIAVFLIILATNRIDKRHFETAQKAVTTVYEDRVLAQDYIYKLNTLFRDKHQLLTDTHQPSQTKINVEIKTLLERFSETELTNNESKIFNKLNTDFEKYKRKEIQFFKNVNTGFKSIKEKQSLVLDFTTCLNTLHAELDNLADIQVYESRMILSNAQKSLHVNALMSQVEIYFLLCIVIVVLIVTFYKIKKRNTIKSHTN